VYGLHLLSKLPVLAEFPVAEYGGLFQLLDQRAHLHGPRAGEVARSFEALQDAADMFLSCSMHSVSVTCHPAAMAMEPSSTAVQAMVTGSIMQASPVCGLGH
jgi:hypothetical protein